MELILSITKNVFKNIFKDDCFGSAAEMAFNFILAIFPFFVLLTALFGLFGTEGIVDQIINSFNQIAPKNALELVEDVLHGVIESSTGGLFTIGLVTTVWISSNAVITVMKALNRAYGIKDSRTYFEKRILAISIVFMFALIIFISFNMIIFGRTLLTLIYKYFPLPDFLFNTVLFVRWPITFIALITMALVFYYFLPFLKENKTKRLFSAIPGTLFFSVFWLVISWAFSLYVDNFSRFNAVYGTLGAVVVLLVWLYYSSLIILVGGEINSEVYKEVYLEPEAVKETNYKMLKKENE